MAQKFFEGQTATNPQTGQKIMWRQGRWYPMGGGGPGTPPAAPARLTPQEEIQLKEARESANAFNEVASQADRFSDLNEKAATGPIYKIPGAKMVGEFFSPELSQMNALQARMAPQQREPGSGTTSDRDLALFMQAIPSVERMGAANGAIAKDMRGMADKRGARAAFLDNYAQRNGTLRGAQEAFDRYWNGRQQRERGGRGKAPSAPGGGYKILSVE